MYRSIEFLLPKLLSQDRVNNYTKNFVEKYDCGSVLYVVIGLMLDFCKILQDLLITLGYLHVYLYICTEKLLFIKNYNRYCHVSSVFFR